MPGPFEACPLSPGRYLPTSLAYGGFMIFEKGTWCCEFLARLPTIITRIDR
jgi:hypothetical protein